MGAANALDQLLDGRELRIAAVENSPFPLTFPSSNPTKAIDWILLSSDLEVVRYLVPRVPLSDHLPVVSTFEFPE